MNEAIYVLIAVALAVLRAMGHRSPMFQATAHLFVGYLLGVYVQSERKDKFALWTVIALSIVEVACFLYFRHQGV